MKKIIQNILILLLSFFSLFSIGYSATVINSLPYNISVSGDYELGGDLYTTEIYGIVINASNVNLDCKDFNIILDNYDQYKYAINITGNNSNISNCYIENLNVIKYENSNNNLLTNVSINAIYSNYNSIYLYNSTNNTFNNLIFIGDGHLRTENGIYQLSNSIFESEINIIFNNENESFCLNKFINVTHNLSNKYVMFFNSSVNIDNWTNISEIILCNADNSIIKNLNSVGTLSEYGYNFEKNSIYSIYTDYSNFTNLNISHYGMIYTESGMLLDLNSTNNLFENLIFNNNRNGLYLGKNSNYNMIINSNFFNNSESAIITYSNQRNVFLNNIFENNTKAGIYFTNSNDNLVKDSKFKNSSYGIDSSNPSNNNNNFTNLVIELNKIGIKIYGHNNILINISSFNNSQNGIDISYGIGNKLYNSTLFNNFENNFNVEYIPSCNLVFQNVTDNFGRPLMFYNSSIIIDGWTNISELILCNADNSVIKNLYLVGNSGVGTPLYLVGIDNTNILNITGSNYSYGLILSLVNRNNISNLNLHDNSNSGLLFRHSDNNILSNFISYNNLKDGITLEFINNNNILSNFEVYNNSETGLNDYNYNNNNTFYNFSTHDNGLYGLYGWSEIGNSRFYNFSSYNNTYGMYFDDAYNVNNNFTNFNIFNNTYGISLLDNNENFIFSNGSILNSVNEDITISEYTTNNTFFNNYLGSALKMNILSTDVYFNYTNGSGDNIGNYWTDIECIETTLVGTYNVCINPSEYQINPILFDYAPLLTEVKVPYFNHSIQCDFGSGFENCENMIYNLVLEKVRVNCTSLNESAAYPTNASILFKNVQDNKEYFNYTVLSQVGGWFEYDNSDFNLIDSGNFIFETICVDNNSNSQIFKNKTYIPFGVLNVSLISPSSNISVLNNSFFSFISRVECSGGECGSVNFTLDPISGDTSYTISNEGNLYDTYGCTTPATPDDTDEGIYEIVDLGFDFPFFNTVIPSGTSFYVYTNGRLTTNSTYVAYDEINDLNFQSSLTIAPIWYDLYIDSDIYVCANQGISPNKFAVIKFDDSLTRNYNDNSLVGAEIVLFENGDIYYNYGNVENTAGGIFYGLSLGDGNSYTYNVTLDSNAELSYDSIHYSYISNLGYISKNEVVPMNFGSPFYTTTQNPMDFATNSCLANMIDGDFCDISWNVFANATINNTYRFFTYANALNYSSNIVQDNSDFVFIKVNESVFIPVGLIDYISPTPINNSRYGGENFTIRIDNANQSAYNVTINSEMFTMTDLGGNVFEYTTSFSTITNVTFQVNYIDGSLEERFFTFYPDYSNNLVPAYGFVSFLTSIFIMLFSLFKFENFNQKMNRKNKKGLTVAISAMLLLLVGVSVAVSLSIWYSNFTLSYETKKLNAQVSANSFEIIGIDNISNQNFIYIKSSASGYTIIDKIKVNDQVCELVNSNVLIGLSVNEIQVDCTNIDFNNNLIDVFTKSAIVTKNLPLTNS